MIALLLALAALSAVAAAPLTPAEARGQQIFLRGTSASGREVTAVVAGNASPAPLACATCHGRDGRGRPEGGVRPANLTWEMLTRASDARPAYDAARLVRAITMGIDAGGRQLNPVMPRYRLWREDADDLVAWLRRLGSMHDPGVDDSTLQLHIAGPMRSVFQAWADSVNARGGIYARMITLASDDANAASAASVASAANAASATAAADAAAGSFAILGDPDDALTRAAIAEDVPVVRAGTITAPAGPWVFELGADAADEVARLLDIAASEGAMPVAIPPEASAFADLCRGRAPRCTLAANPSSARAVLVLNPREMPASTGQLALVPSAIASDALARANGDAFVAARILPNDIDPTAAARYTLTKDRLVDQWSALAIATLTERALVRAGRDVTRESFVEALAAEYEAPTGFSPPVTFGSTRRHGIGTVRILHFDGATRQLTPR